jgi:hypothetical protein
VLVYFNSTETDVTISSVNGYLKYSVSPSSISSPIGWTDLPTERKDLKPYNEFQINIQDRVGPEEKAATSRRFVEGIPVSIEFHLRITAVSQTETFELKTWDGVSCAIKTVPVVEGILVAMAGVAGGSRN